MLTRPTPRFDPARLVPAAMPAILGCTFAWAALEFVRGGREASEQLDAMSRWLGYEFLASTFGILLPLSSLTERALARVGIPRLGSWPAVAALWVPFFLLAIGLSHSLEDPTWPLIGFGCFAAAHAISYVRSPRHDPATDPAQRLRLAGHRLGVVYGSAGAAAAAASFCVFGPLDVFGVPIDSDARLPFMSVAIGAFYFWLLALIELAGTEDYVIAKREYADWIRRRDDDWLRRSRAGQRPRFPDCPTPPPASGHVTKPEELAAPSLPIDRLRHDAFEQWIDDVPINRDSADAIQYWDRRLVRFGRPLAELHKGRAAGIVGTALAWLVALGLLFVSLHPKSFEAKHAKRPRATASAESDRSAMAVGAGFAFLVGLAFLGCWWYSNRKTLEAPHATIDYRHGKITGKLSHIVLELAEATVRAERMEADADSKPTRHADWRVVATNGRREFDLIRDVSLRDAEILVRMLEDAGKR